MVMSHSVNLAKCVDTNGKPTAGTRLEIPAELKQHLPPPLPVWDPAPGQAWRGYQEARQIR